MKILIMRVPSYKNSQIPQHLFLSKPSRHRELLMGMFPPLDTGARISQYPQRCWDGASLCVSTTKPDCQRSQVGTNMGSRNQIPQSDWRSPPGSSVTPGRVALLRQIGQSTIILATACDRQNLNFKRIKLPFLLCRLWSTWKIQPQGSGSNAHLSENHDQFLKAGSVVNVSD